MLASRRQGSILLLTLDRPSKRNALHPEMIRSLTAALDDVTGDNAVRAVVLTGAGASFCAGLDLGHLAGLDGAARVDYMRSAFDLFRRIHDLPQPTIAAVNGPAMAGGFDIAALCDLRICSPEARFAQTEILLGLTQILYPLYESIGLARAKELAMTGVAIPADEAYRIGLVNRVVPGESLLEEALALAATLAQRPREALFATKRLSRELLQTTAADPFDRMFEVIAGRLRSEEHARALESYLATLREPRSRAGSPQDER